jgi:endonuclease/exonuclease/phosphatase family metal-dependent hydrolase
MAFRVSTLNCFGMAQASMQALLKETAHAGERFEHEQFVAECVTADVLCVQELMCVRAERFFDGLPGFADLHRDHNRFEMKTATVRGTGLGIGSRRAPLSKTVHHFARPAAGWDRFARKGALHVRVPLGESAVDVLTVHLQAGDDPAALAIRARQVEHLRVLVEALGDAERPFVIAGDFNIQGLSKHKNGEYARLTKALEGFDDLGAADDLPTFDPRAHPYAREFQPEGQPLRIDYIFFRPARSGAGLRFVTTERFLDRPLRPANGKPALYASDHYGLTAIFEADG